MKQRMISDVQNSTQKALIYQARHLYAGFIHRHGFLPLADSSKPISEAHAKTLAKND
jgi:hypothetical protein